MNQDSPGGKSRIYIWFPLLFAGVLVAGIFIGMKMQSASPSVQSADPEAMMESGAGQGKIEELLRYIEAKYVDEVDREELIQQTIDHLLAQLDPHSSYIPANELQEVNEQLEGNFDGIGVEFLMLEDTVVVVSPMAGGPSEAVGILAGDRIVMIEDSTIAGKGLESRDIIDMLRGEQGSKVVVGILRGAEKKVRKFTIARDKIPMQSMDIATMLDKKTGYIKLNRFSATTYEEFMKGLEGLVTKKGMKDLVIDLRHNPGGYLQQASNILSQLFTEKDKLLVYTEGRAVSRSEYETTGRPFFDVEDVVVLIDEGSASASEILAGAIQDQDRGVVVGRRSFGKGLVQEQYRLRDGSALRLTVARYYTPSGRSIQKPYKGEDPENYEEDVYDRYKSGELSGKTGSRQGDTTRFYTAEGHVVYAGGGISPDVFVPIDTLLMNDYFIEARQYIPQYAFRYVQDNKKALDKFKDANTFNQQFDVADAIYADFRKFLKKQEVKEPSNVSYRIKNEIKLLMKARIAKQLFGDEGLYTVLNSHDSMLKKAVEILHKPDPLAIKNTKNYKN